MTLNDVNEGVVLGISGSVRFAAPEDVVRPQVDWLVVSAIYRLRPERIVCGDEAHGVDWWARQSAGSVGYTVESGRFVQYRPLFDRMDGHGGYRWRNQGIADASTAMLVMRSAGIPDGVGGSWETGRFCADRAGDLAVRWYSLPDEQVAAEMTAPFRPPAPNLRRGRYGPR